LTGALGTYLNYQQGQNYLNARFPQQAAAPITDYSYYSQPASSSQDPYAGFRIPPST
jgi:hypothetical protein